jgi:hypothetical protein
LHKESREKRAKEMRKQKKEPKLYVVPFKNFRRAAPTKNGLNPFNTPSSV